MLKLIYPVLNVIVALAVQLLCLGGLLLADQPLLGWMLIIEGLVFLIQAARAWRWAKRHNDFDIGDRQTASSIPDEEELGIGA